VFIEPIPPPLPHETPVEEVVAPSPPLISEVLVVTLLCKEDSSVSILETVLYVSAEGIMLPEESNPLHFLYLVLIQRC